MMNLDEDSGARVHVVLLVERKLVIESCVLIMLSLIKLKFTLVIYVLD